MNDNNTTPVETLFEKIEGYSKSKIQLFALNTIDKSADVVSSLATRLIITMVITMFVITVNIGIVFWIGELLGTYYYGFFIISIFYMLMGLLLYIFGNIWIKTPISNTIISQMLKQKIYENEK